MALGESLVVWSHASVPFLQFCALVMEFSCGRSFALQSQIEDGLSGVFGLYFRSVDEVPIPEAAEEFSIYRTRYVHELPVGELARVDHHQDRDGNVLELSLSIGSSIVTLLAGEIYEHDGQYRIVAPDESVLVRMSGVDA